MLENTLRPLVATTLLVCLLVPGRAGAEKVLVRFESLDGVPLVASGDPRTPPSEAGRQAALKRVRARAAAIAAARDDLLASLSAPLAAKAYGDYVNIPLVRMDVDAADRLELLGHPQVVAVYPDRKVYPLMESSLAYLGAQSWFDEDFTGEGTAVAVLDTGIRYWNGHFGDCDPVGAEGCRVKEFLGFATLTWGSGETDPRLVAEASGHGTNCGGIVGELAPGTDLLSLGVFAKYDPDSSSGFEGGVLSNDGDVARALDWCISNVEEYNIVAANLSLGSSVDPNATGMCSGWMAGSYEASFANARDAGIIPAVATGNDYVKTAVGPPACVPSALRVTAGYDDPAFGYTCGTGPVIPGSVTCFANSSSLVDIVAPGNDIDAGGLFGFSGTSMAAPHGAGIVALYASRYETDPLWTIERIRSDAVTVQEIGPQQVYTHRYIRVGDEEAELVWDTGAVFESTFEGTPIPDGSDDGVELTTTVTCTSELCGSDVAGNVYVDLTVDTTSTTDLVIELENPAGTVAHHAIDDPAEIGTQNVNSILGSQHLPGVFGDLSGGPVEGEWKLRLYDDTTGTDATLYKAVLFIDSARLELEGHVSAPAVARPDMPFDVAVDLDNDGNLDLSGASLSLELLDAESGEMVDVVALTPDLPLPPGETSSHEAQLVGPQGSYRVRLLASDLDPDIGPGFQSEPQDVSITYRTFASFAVEPEAPVVMTEAELVVLSRGMVESHLWDFGDGTTSTAEEPIHVWEVPGDYEVTLTVTGPDGVSTTGRTITVLEEPTTIYGARGRGAACAVSAPAPVAPAAWVLLAALAAFALALGRAMPGRRRTSALLAVLALAAAGCEPAAVEHDGGPEATVAHGPWVSLLDPGDPTMGDIEVWVMLSSEEPAVCDVSLRYRVGSGDFIEATLSDPDSARDLASTPEGTDHALAWETTTDLPGDTRDVQLEAVASCGGAVSLPVQSSRFSVLNFLVTHEDAVLITEVCTAEDNDLPADIIDGYVELTNTTDEPIPLEGWILIITGPDGRSHEHHLDRLELVPGDRVALTGADARSVPGGVELDEELPWSPVSGGAVALVASHERGADFVRWGGSPTPPPADLVWRDEPVLPIPQIYTVLNRVDEATDTDSSADFCVGRPSPGQATRGCITQHDEGQVLITELDTQGQYDRVEILNDADERVELGGWILLWDGVDLGSGQIPIASFGIDPGQRVVLQDNGVAGRYHSGTLDLGQNLNIDGLIPTALGLQDPYGRVIDYVAAGGSKVRWLDWHDTGPTPMPGPDRADGEPGPTLSRRPGDPDTDSGDDFCLTEDNMGTGASECLEPMDIVLVISEVMPGRPDWVEIYNPGPDTVDLGEVYLSYTAPYYGGSVGDFLLTGTLPPGEMVVVSEGDLGGIPEILVDRNIALGSDGDGSVALRDYYGFGIDFMMWGEPAGVPLWPDTWEGLGQEPTEDLDSISIQRTPHDAPDTDTRDDWCWAVPSALSPNTACL